MSAASSISTWIESPETAADWLKSGWQRVLSDGPMILGRLLTAAVLIVAGILLLRLGRRIINRIYDRKNRKAEKQPIRQTKTLHSLLLSVFNYIMYFVIAMAVLSALGVDVSSLLTVAGIGGIAIGFGSQTLVKDVISGLFLWVDGHVNVGDVVTVAGQTGRVESMSVRTTVLRGTNGYVYSVPNGDIRTVVNMSAAFRYAQVDVTVAHGQNIARAMEVLQEEMDALKERLGRAEAPQVLGVIATDRGGATVRIECKCKVEEDWALEREIRLAALDRMTLEGIKP